ncbi:MAG: AAA family ATPase [Gammaproteobacteria bacterium]|nr:AAA family ATPase [Gammaproteobacteria bacterium]
MAQDAARPATGLIIGKFMPPHRGHQVLVDFARQYVDRLTVLVCSLDSYPISGALSFAWMREAFPDVDVRHVTEDLPQEPSEHPDFWAIWRAVIRREMPGATDYVFASEDYGWKLADVLGARYIPVDHDRQWVPISATQIRRDPLAHWDYLLPGVRSYYLRRVCVFGPESTGKSTLARDLAQYYRTVHVSEYARGLLDHKAGRCDPEDIPLIAKGQMAAEDALVRQANRVLFCDTDLLTTTIWSEVLFGYCLDWIREEAERRQYDLYLLTDIDVPWVDDAQRYLPHRRQEFMDRCRQALDRRGRPYVLLSGNWARRLQRACRAVDELLSG